MGYSVIHYCHILPTFKTIDSNLSLLEAERIANHKKKMWLIKHPYHHCCQWFVQKES